MSETLVIIISYLLLVICVLVSDVLGHADLKVTEDIKPSAPLDEASDDAIPVSPSPPVIDSGHDSSVPYLNEHIVRP